jgi:hypothetical protein
MQHPAVVESSGMALAARYSMFTPISHGRVVPKAMAYRHGEIEHRPKGYWLAQSADLPGAPTHGASSGQAVNDAMGLAVRNFTDRTERY